MLDQIWSSAGPIARSKFAWMLGVSGTADSAVRLRAILADETDATVLGNALFALSRCPPSDENRAAVARLASDERLIRHAFGFYPHGWYGALGKTARTLPSNRSASWPTSIWPGTTPPRWPRWLVN
jgi:hypothetical protein